MSQLVFVGAVLPSFLLAWMVYKADRYQEPEGKFIAAFLIGMASPLVTLMISGPLAGGLNATDAPWLTAFLGAAIPEELGRFLLLLLICKKWKDVDEPFDCIVYAAAIWGGFAGTENILYAMGASQEGVDVDVILSLRAALCSVGHTAWGVIVGAYVGMALFGQSNRLAWALQGLVISIVLHGLYDALLFSMQGGAGSHYLFGALAVDALTAVLALLIIRRMGRIQAFSEGEGRSVIAQVRLMRHYRPDRPGMLGARAEGLGLLGLFQVLMVLFFAACTYFSALQLAGGNIFNAAPGVITGGLGLITWKALWRRIERIESQDLDALNVDAENVRASESGEDAGERAEV